MNYLTYPLKVMNITQGYNDNYTHKRHSEGNLKDYPIDDACGSGNNSYFYCPCDEMVVKKVYGVGLRASNTIWLESTTPVITPTFTDYITIMIVHPKDKDLKNVYVGRKYQRNEALFPKGADGFASSSIFCSNNLRQCVTGFTEYLCSKDEQSLHRGIYFGKVLLSFYGGVAVSFLATQILDLKASWIGILPTVSAFLLCNVEYGRCKVKKEDILKASA